MLNYIWAGLIILSLVFALVTDAGELSRDTYRNGQPVPVALAFPGGYDPAARSLPVRVRLDSAALAGHYGQALALAPADVRAARYVDYVRAHYDQLAGAAPAPMAELLVPFPLAGSDDSGDYEVEITRDPLPGDRLAEPAVDDGWWLAAEDTGVIAVPAAVAILPASSLVRMPPRDSSDSAAPAIASICGVMRSTSGISLADEFADGGAS